MNVTAAGDLIRPDSTLFAVDAHYDGRCARLALRGELDIATVRLLEDELRIVWARDVRRIEIDLRELTFVGSAGVAALLEANSRARGLGLALTLVRGTVAIQRVFELTGVEAQFAFRSDTARPDERGARGGPLGIVR